MLLFNTYNIAYRKFFQQTKQTYKVFKDSIHKEKKTFRWCESFSKTWISSDCFYPLLQLPVLQLTSIVCLRIVYIRQSWNSRNFKRIPTEPHFEVSCWIVFKVFPVILLCSMFTSHICWHKRHTHTHAYTLYSVQLHIHFARCLLNYVVACEKPGHSSHIPINT